MALIVEDGSIVSGAESLCSVATADAYFSKRGNAAWALLATPAKEQSLRKATDYMGRYSWKGLIVAESQALDWPRTGVVVRGYEIDYTSVPDAIKAACAELAVRAAVSPLLEDEERMVRSEQVGPIAVTYEPYAPQAKKYPAVDKLLAPYLSGLSGVNVRLERV